MRGSGGGVCVVVRGCVGHGSGVIREFVGWESYERCVVVKGCVGDGVWL